MDTNKETYQTPSVLIFEVKTEGVICQSVGNRGNYTEDDDNPFA